ncbi:MAG: LysR family transcriptional regulator, partial [Actinobacteria bacterium]|nr:LysR family transcriptional regulator [Actinomycetota bacterium]
MDGREIEAFLVLAEELHFGRTARRLGVSPGRVSQLLAALERRTGRQLVLRSSRTVGLSAAGEQFLAEARTGYRQLEQAIAATRAAARQNAGVLRLGTSVWLDPAAGATLAEAFEHRHCGWRAECVPVRPADLPGPLTGGDADVLLLPVPGPFETGPFPSGIVAGPVLERHERVLVVPGGHPLAGHALVSPADLAGHEVACPADHLPARRPGGGLPAPGDGPPGGDPAPRAPEPHDAFDLVV